MSEVLVRRMALSWWRVKLVSLQDDALGAVDLTSNKAPRYTAIAKHQQDVSAATVEEWEKELMEDPKVAYKPCHI
jgi:hypothetical protein